MTVSEWLDDSAWRAELLSALDKNKAQREARKVRVATMREIAESLRNGVTGVDANA